MGQSATSATNAVAATRIDRFMEPLDRLRRCTISRACRASRREHPEDNTASGTGALGGSTYYEAMGIAHLLSAALPAALIRVPADQPTITAALAVATSGDEIVVPTSSGGSILPARL